MINVTRPSLPPLEEFQLLLAEIWRKNVLTNGGDFHKALEKELAVYLDVEYISLFSNGTIALITALQALGIKGEVITTPYSFVATTNALIWNGIKPVFVDIDPYTCNLDPCKIEAAITSETSAILPVHVYGVPCNVDSIEAIAKKHNLKVIYDAAHAFAVQHNQKSILKSGDLSVLSFHATKVFNTIEGGAIICNSSAMKQHIDNLKNFGIVNELSVVASGINGKMNELQAAFGLLNLKYLNENIQRREKCWAYYSKALSGLKGLRIMDISSIESYNFSYFPVFIDADDFGKTRDQLHYDLKNNGINGRRYFYPLISNFSIYTHLPSSKFENLQVANRIADQVICLPLYPDLLQSEMDIIIYHLLKDYKYKERQ